MRLPPAPRDSGQKWLAFGAVVVVIVGVSWASSAFKKHLTQSLPQPEPPPLFDPPSNPAPPSSAEPDDDDAPPADDAKPKFASSIEASAQTRPAWSPAGPYAPQHSKAVDLYASGSSIAGPLFRTFVACRVEANDPSDGELELRMKVGASPEIVSRSQKNATTAFATAPLASLEKGETVSLRASVRNGEKVTELARVSAALGDNGLTVPETHGIDVDCVTLAQSDLDDRVAKDAGRADVVIRRLVMPKLDYEKIDWAYPHDDLARARLATSDVAALVGWDDARAKRRVSALVGVQASLDAASAPVFEHLHRSATKSALAADLEVKLESLSCTKRCTAKLSVTNSTDHAIAWTGEGAPRRYVATKHGGPQFFEASGPPWEQIGAGVTATVTLVLPDLPPKEPAILGICGPSRCGALALR
jgi:hypothetical protein